MFPERIKLDIEDEINGFERTTLERLLTAFDDIEPEAGKKRMVFLESKSERFNPDIDDEACIEEEAYFEALSHIFNEQDLKQEFLNSAATWLFHLFERQKKRVLGSDKTKILEPKLATDGYSLDSCQDWLCLNEELRLAANSVKHGPESDAAKKLLTKYPNLVDGDSIKISKSDLERFIGSLRVFWGKALDGKVVL